MTDFITIYGDESGVPNENIQSITLISGLAAETEKLKSDADEILKKYSVSELKSANLKSKKHIDVAKELVEIAIKMCALEKIRIDTIIFDMKDSRHCVKGRDEIKNFEIMYYNLIIHVLKKWPQEKWKFYPDQHSSVDWKKLVDYAEGTNLKKKELKKEGLFDYEKELFSFKEMIDGHQKISGKNSLIQIADLFAGIVRCSYENGRDFLVWRHQNDPMQVNLFSLQVDCSKNQKYKFEVMKKICDCCHFYKFKTNIERYGFFKTSNPKDHLNFWNYKPQGDYDKAPKKN